MDRLKAIREYAKIKNEAAERQKAAEEKKYAENVEKIHSLKKRIGKLVETAKECVENGVDIDAYNTHLFSFGYDSYESGAFFSNSTTHLVGFLYCGDDIYVGIANGGACGNVDIKTCCRKLPCL